MTLKARARAVKSRERVAARAERNESKGSERIDPRLGSPSAIVRNRLTNCEGRASLLARFRQQAWRAQSVARMTSTQTPATASRTNLHTLRQPDEECQASGRPQG